MKNLNEGNMDDKSTLVNYKLKIKKNDLGMKKKRKKS